MFFEISKSIYRSYKKMKPGSQNRVISINLGRVANQVEFIDR